MDIFSAFGIPEQLLNPRQPRSGQSQMDAHSKHQVAHSDPKPIGRPIIVNVMDRGDHDGAKLHFAEKQMKLTENKENGKPVLAARTTARRKGNPNMEKVQSPCKKPETREG